jgi:hypothetical protein
MTDRQQTSTHPQETIMNSVNKVALAAATIATIGVATSSAYAGSNLNGPELTGVALPSLEASQPAITAVTLPTGVTVDLPSQANR